MIIQQSFFINLLNRSSKYYTFLDMIYSKKRSSLLPKRDVTLASTVKPQAQFDDICKSWPRFKLFFCISFILFSKEFHLSCRGQQLSLRLSLLNCKQKKNSGLYYKRFRMVIYYHKGTLQFAAYLTIVIYAPIYG